MTRSIPALFVLCLFALGAHAQPGVSGPVLLTCDTPAVVGGTPLDCEVWLMAPAAGEVALAVTLLGTDAATAQAPANIVLRSGERKGRFRVMTAPVSARTPVTVSVAHTGESLATTRHVLPPSVRTLSTASNVAGGAPVRGRIALTGPAPINGLAVHLDSSNPRVATVPDPLVIPAGAETASFEITTRPVESGTLVMLSASIPDAGEARFAPLFVSREARPDLEVAGWSFRDAAGMTLEHPPAGQAYHACIHVANSGAAGAATHRLRLILLGEGERTREQEEGLPALNAGANTAACFGLPALDPARSYVFNAYVDYGNEVREADEHNNFQAYEYPLQGPAPSQPALTPELEPDLKQQSI